MGSTFSRTTTTASPAPAPAPIAPIYNVNCVDDQEESANSEDIKEEEDGLCDNLEDTKFELVPVHPRMVAVAVSACKPGTLLHAQMYRRQQIRLEAMGQRTDRSKWERMFEFPEEKGTDYEADLEEEGRSDKPDMDDHNDDDGDNGDDNDEEEEEEEKEEEEEEEEPESKKPKAATKKAKPKKPVAKKATKKKRPIATTATAKEPPTTNGTANAPPTTNDTAKAPPAKKPKSDKYAVGTKILKKFDGYEELFEGTVTEYDSDSGLHHILYDDGDEEDLLASELEPWVVPSNK